MERLLRLLTGVVAFGEQGPDGSADKGDGEGGDDGDSKKCSHFQSKMFLLNDGAKVGAAARSLPEKGSEA